MGRTGIFRSEAARAQYLEEFYEPALARWSIPHESIYVQTSFGMVHVIRCGNPDGEPVILANGVGEDATYWGRTELLPALCERYEVLVPDRIGDPGKSVMTRRTDTCALDAMWMKELVIGLERGPANFIGLHFGGWQLVCYDVYLARRLRRCIMVNPAGGVVSMRPIEMLRMFLCTTSRRALECFARGNAPPGYDPDPEQLEIDVKRLRYVRKHCRPVFAMPRRFSFADLSGVDTPTLFLFGEYNRWYDLRKYRSLVNELMHSSDVRFIEGAGLDPLVEKPKVSTELIMEYLARPEPTE